MENNIGLVWDRVGPECRHNLLRNTTLGVCKGFSLSFLNGQRYELGCINFMERPFTIEEPRVMLGRFEKAGFNRSADYLLEWIEDCEMSGIASLFVIHKKGGLCCVYFCECEGNLFYLSIAQLDNLYRYLEEAGSLEMISSNAGAPFPMLALSRSDLIEGAK